MKQNTLRAPYATLTMMLLVGISQPMKANQTAAPNTSEMPDGVSPTHTLFMGVELAVQRDELTMPVRDVQGSSIIAKRKGKEVRIPTTAKALNLKVTRSLKVTAQAATLDKMVVERAYSADRDPLKKFAAQSGAQAGAEAVAAFNEGQMVDAMVSHDFNQVRESLGLRVNLEETKARVDKLSQQYKTAYHIAESGTLTAGEAASELNQDLAEAAYDAIRISFKVSSEKPLLGAYVVVLAELRAGEKTKETRQNWVYAKSLGLVNANPQTVYINQSGFPLGYVIERCEVHLFDQGEEIATNASPMRVQLSRDEAFQYAAIEYITQNKGGSRPADLAGGQNTETLRAHIEAHYRGGPIYVSVSKDGLARGIFRDKAGEHALNDDALLEIVRTYRFNPALVGGKPLDSIVPVRISPNEA